MELRHHYIGERLSLHSQQCTIRYIGSVADKAGTWLGVEWDDPQRGRHNGTHEGVAHFECRSKSPTTASFLRPTQEWDEPRTFLQALREKYMPDFNDSNAETIYFSGKQAEEVGFQKFHKRQAQLQGIRVLVLDHMRIKHTRLDASDETSIAGLCTDITDLDLSGNLFETFGEILKLSSLFPKLRVLTLDGNRFSVEDATTCTPLLSVKVLNLSQTLLKQPEVNRMVADYPTPIFPSLSTLSLGGNEFQGPLKLLLPTTMSIVDLSNNELCAMSDLESIDSKWPLLHSLILKQNRISAVCDDARTTRIFRLRATELDLSYNAIDSFSFFDDVNSTTFPNLRHLRVTGNSLYKSLVSAEGKTLTAEDGYMLTIARLPQLEYLNYSKITEKERLNAETYYLGQMTAELAIALEGRQSKIIAKHPRWKELCDEYGEPTIQRKLKGNEVTPNSLAARLVKFDFDLAPGVLPHIKQRAWTDEIPKSFTVYAVLGMVGKRLGQMPLDLRLVLETNERDPVGQDANYGGPEWWDSSDDESESGKEEWVKREVEMVAGTRAVGTYVESAEAIIRIETRHDPG